MPTKDKKSVLSFNSYKSLMKHLLTEGERGQLSRAAEFLNCQRSFLSRVMNSEVHLTPDHAFELSRFWNFSAEEADYFQTLVEAERAASPKYRDYLKAKIVRIKKENEDLAQKVNRPKMEVGEKEVFYYSSWVWSALHLLTSIPKYQSTQALSQKLGLPVPAVEFHLQQLESLGLLTHQKGKWEFRGESFHLDKGSPLVNMHHQNWRAKALVDAQMQKDNVHFTNVQTLSARDYQRIKEMLMKFIADSAAIAGPSDPEEAMVFACDLFQL